MEMQLFAALAARAGGGCRIAAVGEGAAALCAAFARQTGASQGAGEGGGQAAAVLRTESGAVTLAAYAACPQGDAFDAAVLVPPCADVDGSACAAVQGAGKPFVCFAGGGGEQSGAEAAARLAEECGVPLVSCGAEDLSALWEALLFAFPPASVEIGLPAWMSVLPAENEAVAPLLQKVRDAAPSLVRLSDCARLQEVFADDDVYCEDCSTDPATGRAVLRMAAREGVFYRMLGRACGAEIPDDLHLMAYVSSLKEAKRFHDKFAAAFAAADADGYGLAAPAEEDMRLQPPEIVRRGGRCGVRLKADAPSYHVLKIDVHSELTPVTGESARSEEIARGMAESYEKDAEGLWNTDMFGRTFKEMAQSALHEKLANMPAEARSKLRRAVGRIVNEGKGGVICILL